jgi:hypothetical protein
MSYRPEDDETSIGRILIAMGLCTPGQVSRVAELQKKSSTEDQMGMFLVAHGLISMKQLELALNAQEGLRSKAKHKRALAQAEIAKQSGSSVVKLADRVRGMATEVKRQTGTEFPAVSLEAKGSDGQ